MWLIDMIDMLFWVYMLMLFGRILASWFPEIQGHTLVAFIAFCTEPYLGIFRAVIPPIGMLDISPIVAFFSLGIIESIVKSIAFALVGG